MINTPNSNNLYSGYVLSPTFTYLRKTPTSQMQGQALIARRQTIKLYNSQ